MHSASSWDHLMACAVQASGYMFEKYDTLDPGHGGGGGEYVPQLGFGWSNGVALMLLDWYGDDLLEPLREESVQTTSCSE